MLCHVGWWLLMFWRTVLLSFSASSSPRRVHCWTG